MGRTGNQSIRVYRKSGAALAETGKWSFPLSGRDISRKIKAFLRDRKDLPHIKKLRTMLHGRKGSTLAILGLIILSVVLIVVLSSPGENPQVKASPGSEDLKVSSWILNERNASLPPGVAGLASCVEDMPARGSRVKRMGTSAETVLVGQRYRTVSDPLPSFDCSATMTDAVADLSETTVSRAVNANLMSDYDYENLCRIVEAEAGTEDIKGRILVANVIMNRIANPEFPDNITDVIFHYDNGVAQFSPVYDGRIYSVTVSDETREAVRQVMEGTDYSEGALFFIQKDAADQRSVHWFEKNLKRLFKYGVHEFYTYP